MTRRTKLGGQSVSNSDVRGSLYQLSNVSGDVTIHGAPPRNDDTGARVTNLPPRTLAFTGREASLEELTRLVAGPTRWAAIHGLGGIGKSVLALEYAYRHIDEFRILWWIRAENASSVRTDLLQLAGRLGIDVKAEAEAALESLRGALGARDDWLLLFDNAESAEHLRGVLPPSVGTILFTTRSPHWEGLAAPLELRKLDPAESARLLSPDGGDDDPAVGELANELDHLPLALAQACAYVTMHTTVSYRDYLELFRQRRDYFLRRNETLVGYPTSVATTWLIHFEFLKAEVPAAIHVLNLVSFLEGDRIALEPLLTAARPGTLPHALAAVVPNPIVLHECVGALMATSLIQNQGGGTVGVHRLVQTVTRMQLRPADQKKWAERAIKVLYAALPLDVTEPDGWSQARPFVDNVPILADHADHYRVGREMAFVMLNKAAIYHGEYGDPHTARDLLERALKVAESVGQQLTLPAMSTAANLAIVLNQIGDYQAALVLANRNYQFARTVLGPRSSEASEAATGVANVLQNLGMFDEAHALHCEALSIDEALHGSESVELVKTLTNMGNVLLDMECDVEAAESYERAVRIMRQAGRDDHPELAAALVGLARVVQLEGDHDAAEHHLLAALDIQLRLWGRNDEVGNSLRMLGRVEESRHRRAAALGYYQDALAAYEAALPRDPRTELLRSDVRRMRHRRLLRRWRPEWRWRTGDPAAAWP